MATPTGATPADLAEVDILVIGGGTAGLALAARIATSSSLSVGVLEAGQWRPDDPLINIPAMIGQNNSGEDYDWGLKTVPQPNSNNREYVWPRGKVLGGSSALNYLVWQRGHTQEFDSWEKLGNPGWNWESMAPFFKKTATVLPPSSQLQKDNFAGIDEKIHGKDGPIQVSYSAWYTEPQKKWMTALKELGFNHQVDGLSGSNSGVWLSPATLDSQKGTRSYSASAHFGPNKDLPNFKVLCGAHTKEILLDGKKAVGCKYEHEGKEYTVKARKEVVVSGGTVNSPQLLELSGIGNPAILKQAGIRLKHKLPGVGQNLQEHLYVTSSYELIEGFETWDSLKKPDFAEEAKKKYGAEGAADRGILAGAFSGFAFCPLQTYLSQDEIQEIKDEVQSHLDTGYYKNAIERESALETLRQLDDQTVPAMEFIFAPCFLATASAPKEDKNYFSILTCLQKPLTRGEIHVSSNNFKDHPLIDPKYFTVKSDLKVMSKAVKYCDRIVESSHLKDLIVARQDPNPEKYSATAESYDEFVKDHSVTEYHAIGTCSLAPEDKQGVVNERLRVHGIENLMVADASVMPLMPSSHIQAVVYAIGERAAAFILEDHAGFPSL